MRSTHARRAPTARDEHDRSARHARRCRAALSPVALQARAPRRAPSVSYDDRLRRAPAAAPSATKRTPTTITPPVSEASRCERARWFHLTASLSGAGKAKLKRCRSSAAGSLDVRRAHQRLADQHRVDAGPRELVAARRACGSPDSATTHGARRHVREQLERAARVDRSVVRSRLLIPITAAPERGARPRARRRRGPRRARRGRARRRARSRSRSSRSVSAATISRIASAPAAAPRGPGSGRR